MSQPKTGLILDVFGTSLLSIQPARNPYAAIMLKSGYIESELSNKLLNHGSKVLRQNMTLEEFADNLCGFASGRAAKIRNDAGQLAMEFEQKNYRVNPDLEMLLQACDKNDIAVCLGTNLGTPYKAIVENLLPQIKYKIYSCDSGFAKPDKQFYEACCNIMGATFENSFILGNSITSDVLGGKNAGLSDSFWLYDPSQESRAKHVSPENTLTKLTDIIPKLVPNA